MIDKPMATKDRLKQMLHKLENPYWTPSPTSRYVTNWQGKVAVFNLYFVLRGRPSKHTAGDIQRYKPFWDLASIVADLPTPVGPMCETLLVTTPNEFWEHVIKPDIIRFARFLPPSEWQRLLNETTVDNLPADLRSYAAMVKKADK